MDVQEENASLVGTVILEGRDTGGRLACTEASREEVNGVVLSSDYLPGR